MNKSSMIALISVIGAGAFYFIMRNNDDIPVGLVTNSAPLQTGNFSFETKSDDGEVIKNKYRYEIHKGTYKESESSIFVYSTDDTSLVVVYDEDGNIFDVFSIDDGDDLITQNDGSNESMIKMLKREKHFASKYGTTEETDQLIADLSNGDLAVDNAQTQNAEMQMFGHISLNALQSNHAW